MCADERDEVGYVQPPFAGFVFGGKDGGDRASSRNTPTLPKQEKCHTYIWKSVTLVPV